MNRRRFLEVAGSAVAGGVALLSAAPAYAFSRPRTSGQDLGSVTRFPVGKVVSFTHRSTGDPGIVMQSKKGVFVAYDAVCPHAGCTVGYSASQKQFACPCHGSTFALATGVRTGGPTPTGLKKLLVTVSKGHLFVH